MGKGGEEGGGGGGGDERSRLEEDNGWHGADGYQILGGGSMGCVFTSDHFTLCHSVLRILPMQSLTGVGNKHRGWGEP